MSWTVDRSKILQPDEIRTVLTDLRRKARRSTNTKMNLVVFRLATCCGLRASEIAGLVLADVQVNSTQPKIRVRREVGKGHKARKVPSDVGRRHAGRSTRVEAFSAGAGGRGRRPLRLLAALRFLRPSVGAPEPSQAIQGVLQEPRTRTPRRNDNPLRPAQFRQPQPSWRPERRGGPGRRRPHQRGHNEHLCTPGRFRRSARQPLRLLLMVWWKGPDEGQKGRHKVSLRRFLANHSTAGLTGDLHPRPRHQIRGQFGPNCRQLSPIRFDRQECQPGPSRANSPGRASKHDRASPGVTSKPAGDVCRRLLQLQPTAGPLIYVADTFMVAEEDADSAALAIESWPLSLDAAQIATVARSCLRSRQIAHQTIPLAIVGSAGRPGDRVGRGEPTFDFTARQLTV